MKASIDTVDKPSAHWDGEAKFGSDAVAETLRALDIPYILLTPGSSYRGLHDSLVNYLGNERPQILLCLHEEHTVAIAHGYAKVMEKPLAAALHANVGLFHATMAIFNAWCDRTPVVIIGATGPVDAAKRRPWIDWIHTARDQGSVVRHYVKWDDQPASPAAAREALLRASWMARTRPQGPVYINLDAGMQEAPLSEPLPPIEAARFMPPVVSAAPMDLVARAAAMLRHAQSPLIMMGRVSRSLEAWNARVAMAEALGAKVVTDLKVPAAFPTDHVLHVGPPAIFVAPQVAGAIRGADAILSLDWLDLAGTLKSAFDTSAPPAQVIQVSLDHHLHNGWSMDYQGLPPVDLFIAADPDAMVAATLEVLRPKARPRTDRQPAVEVGYDDVAQGRISLDHVASALRQAAGGRAISLLQLPLGWNGAVWPFRHPLDYVGSHAGGGVGRGPGFAVGAALALRGSGRLPVAVVGDGDFLMGATAVWTAVHYGIPLLMVIANNRSFFNDELHQERIARMRGRPVENRWVGQRVDNPEIDLARIASAQGAVGFGPIKHGDELLVKLRRAIDEVESGAVAVVDAWVEPGYVPSMTAAMTEKQ